MKIDKAFQLAYKYYQAGNLQESGNEYKKILRDHPRNIDALRMLGGICYQLGDFDGAIRYIKKEIEITPSNADAYHNLGIVFHSKGEFDKAISCYQKAIQLNPNFYNSYINLANILRDKGQFDEAMTFYQRAIELNPDIAEAYNSLGNLMKIKGMFEEAINCYQKALQINPVNPGILNNLGNVLYEKGCFDKALISYQNALELDPDSPYSHFHMSRVLLLTGNYKQGWKEYEWRWKTRDYVERDFSQPRWNGSDISGKTILINTEQGLGDAIQFIRYVPLVVQRGATIIVECQKELVSLFQNVEGVKQVIKVGEQLPPFDVYCPLLSLPLKFDTTLETIPAEIPYIKVNPFSIQKWKDKVQDNSSKLKVGLVWAGSPTFKRSHLKECPLKMFSPLAHNEDITFFSLQKGKATEQAKSSPDGMNLIDYTDEINDFSDTAAFIINLDLVISVDTAVVHLAGALGKPVWTLLPFVPDWRWMLNREDSPWYPTMRLFRQPFPGDWESVIDNVLRNLELFIRDENR
jgi:tetratricopeptide (TPR) repeat protein